MVKSYPDPNLLVGFAGKRVHTKGFVDLLTTFDYGRTHRTLTVMYLFVEADMSYNVLIGRRTLNALIVSTLPMAMNFPSEQGDIIIVKAKLEKARECYAQSLRVNIYTVRGTSSPPATPLK